MDSSDLSDGPITLQEYLEVKKALAASEAKVQQLMKVNNSLSDELRRLQREVCVPDPPPGTLFSLFPSSPPPHPCLLLPPPLQIHKLQSENTQIRQQAVPPHPTPAPSERPEHGHPPGTAPLHRRDRQAFSMYEPGSVLKPFGQPVEELVTRLQPFGGGVSMGWALGWATLGWVALGRGLGAAAGDAELGAAGLYPFVCRRRWRTKLCTPCTSRPACTG